MLGLEIMDKLFKLACCVLAILLSACVSHPVKIENYAGQHPTLTVQNFFNGHLRGYGALTDNNNKLVNHLTTDIDVHWQGNDGLLKQEFQFSNGAKRYREWCMHVIDEHHFSVVASFYEGTVAGEQYGNVIHMIYYIRLPREKNYYHNLTTPHDVFQAINNSPEHALYTLLTSRNIVADLKAVEGLEQKSAALLKIPKHVEIGAYCSQKNNEWHTQRAAETSYQQFELDNWLFMVDKNVIIQESAVLAHGRKLGEFNLALVKGNS
jgi:hypothetical protein